jgi:DNA-binding phage protein
MHGQSVYAGIMAQTPLNRAEPGRDFSQIPLIQKGNERWDYQLTGFLGYIAGAYLLRYAQEASWREDYRRASNGEQTYRIAGLAMKRRKSVDFTGYWQRHVERVWDTLMHVLERKDILSMLRSEIERAGDQGAWAKKAGVHRSTLNKVLNGHQPPTKTIIRALKLRIVVVSE